MVIERTEHVCYLNYLSLKCIFSVLSADGLDNFRYRSSRCH